MATIRLYIEESENAGEWEYHAKKVDDPHFSTFLAGMQEMCGELPNELRLEGSVADIVRSGWNAYLSIYDLHRVVEAIQAIHKSPSKPKSLRAVCASPTRIICENCTHTTTGHLNTIMNIVNSFPGWEMYAFANYDEEDADIRHLFAMGNALYEHDVTLVNREMLMITHAANCDKELVACEDKIVTMLEEIRGHIFECVEWNDAEKEETYKRQIDKALAALLHNAYLLRFISSDTCLALDNIRWDCVPKLLKELGCLADEDMVDRSSYLVDLAAVFIGKGDVRKISRVPYSLRVTVDSTATTISTDIARGGDLIELYDHIWNSTPENVNPHDIGLDYLLKSPRVHGIDNANCTYLLFQAHHLAVRVATDGTFQLKDDLIATYVAALALTVAGRKGLDRIVKCLTRYHERIPTLTEDVSNRINLFIGYANKLLARERYVDSTTRVDYGVTKRIEAMARSLL